MHTYFILKFYKQYVIICVKLVMIKMMHALNVNHKIMYYLLHHVNVNLDSSLWELFVNRVINHGFCWIMISLKREKKDLMITPDGQFRIKAAIFQNVVINTYLVGMNVSQVKLSLLKLLMLFPNMMPLDQFLHSIKLITGMNNNTLE